MAITPTTLEYRLIPVDKYESDVRRDCQEEFAQDLRAVLPVAVALRSVPAGFISRWLAGERIELSGIPENPGRTGYLSFLSEPNSQEDQPRAYTIQAPSGRIYDLVVTPQTNSRVQDNRVSITYTVLHMPEAKREASIPDNATVIDQAHHVYFLDLAENPPVSALSVDTMRDWLARNNGFEAVRVRKGFARFYDDCWLAMNGRNDPCRTYITIRDVDGCIEARVEIELPCKQLAFTKGPVAPLPLHE